MEACFRGCSRETPLKVVVRYQFLDFIDLLLSAGTTVHDKDSPDQSALIILLINASFKGFRINRDFSKELKIVNKLLGARVDINSRNDYNDQTPLGYAFKTCPELFKTLFDAGADVHLPVPLEEWPWLRDSFYFINVKSHSIRALTV